MEGRTTGPGRLSATVGVAAAFAVGACTGQGPPAVELPAEPAASDGIYLSIGDSYATGFRDTAAGTGPTTEAFPDQVVRLLADGGLDLTLVNLACTGVTVGEALTRPGCDEDNRALDAPTYETAQVPAALQVIADRPGEVELVTIVLGGNDLAPCLPDREDVLPPDSRACVDRVVPRISSDLSRLVRELRSALGPDVPVVGLGYPDLWLALAPTRPDLATATLQAFRDQVNPSLRAAFEDAGAGYVDLTEAFGGDADPGIAVDVPGRGRLPAPVAGICWGTYFCSDRDTHPSPDGHRLIAQAIVAGL